MTRLQIMNILNRTLHANVIGRMAIVAGQGLACEQIVTAIGEEQKAQQCADKAKLLRIKTIVSGDDTYRANCEVIYEMLEDLA